MLPTRCAAKILALAAMRDGREVLSLGTDPLEPDSDGGGVSDGLEINNNGTDPLDPDAREAGQGLLTEPRPGHGAVHGALRRANQIRTSTTSAS